MTVTIAGHRLESGRRCHYDPPCTQNSLIPASVAEERDLRALRGGSSERTGRMEDKFNPETAMPETAMPETAMPETAMPEDEDGEDGEGE